LLAHGLWFSPGTPASSTTKTGRHDIAEILLKAALNTKNQSNQSILSVLNVWLLIIRLISSSSSIRNIFLDFLYIARNISAISWRPVLVVEEAGVPGENHRPWASNW
jgi:hypothetical protein